MQTAYFSSQDKLIKIKNFNPDDFERKYDEISNKNEDKDFSITIKITLILCIINNIY